MEPSGHLPDNQNSQQQVPQLLVTQQSHQNASTTQSQQHHYQSPPTQQSSFLERLSRPMAFDRMESLVREMQDTENGVPVRVQKLFLTSIPSAFMGYDLIEWIMDRLSIEESEALNIANQLCLHGYFFPVSDTKMLVVKDDSSLYRFQTPYYWPWQHKTPDNVEYAIYLVKRSLRNKQRHGLEDYEIDAMASLHKNLKAKWDFITMQAEEQVKLSKDRKKGDKIVADSQERAFWRVYRPPPSQFTPLEACPVPSRDRQGKPRRRTSEDVKREVDYLKSSMGRTRIKMSQACEFLRQYWETFNDYDYFIQTALPSNPWVTEDLTFWQLNNSIVDVPTEKRVRRWSISIEELVSDPTGLQEFTSYLRKEYSHENIRFWIMVNDLRRSAHSQIIRKVREIYEEFLEPGAPCEINIDGKTMEKVQTGLKTPSRFTFDAAAEHIYALLLKKDCYPRFIRSEHYKSLLATGIQPQHKKRFFGFGGAAKKKSSTTAPPNMTLLSQTSTVGSSSQANSAITRRRGSDRSLSGSAHELAICGGKDGNKVQHSHSQSNLSDIPYSVVIYRGDMPSSDTANVAASGERGGSKEVPNVVASTATGVQNASSKKNPEGPKSISENVEVSAVCPWDAPAENAAVSVSVCPWDDEPPSTPEPPAIVGSSTDISEISERMRKTCGIRQQTTLDCDMYSGKRLAPAALEPRRASITIAPSRLSDTTYTFAKSSSTDASTSLSFQPSISKSNETTTSATTPQPNQSQNAAVPTIQSSLSDQSIPLKSESFEEPETFVSCRSIANNPCDMDDEPNKNSEINSEKCVSNSTTNTIEQQVSVCDVSRGVHDANVSLDIVAKVPKECMPINASPPKITVVCAPCTDELILELAARQSTEQIECDVEQVEASVCVPCDADEPSDVAATEPTTTSPKSAPKQLSLEVRKCSEPTAAQEDLSPNMDEYQECCPTGDDYQYDSVMVGCVAPAPTPALVTSAPLAECETYAPDDDVSICSSGIEPKPTENEPTIDETIDAPPQDEQPAPTTRSKKKKQKSMEKGDGSQTKPSDESNRNAICPWEDEDNTSATEGKFVKTYSTLGYL